MPSCGETSKDMDAGGGLIEVVFVKNLPRVHVCAPTCTLSARAHLLVYIHVVAKKSSCRRLCMHMRCLCVCMHVCVDAPG